MAADAAVTRASIWALVSGMVVVLVEWWGGVPVKNYRIADLVVLRSLTYLA
jgi:hypothetical protein